MSTSARILSAFDHVIEGTRQHLESIPDNRLDWKPHDRSYTLGELGTHLANLPTWVITTIDQDEFDVAPPGEDSPWLDPFSSSDEMVRTIDGNATAARAAIEGASDDDLMEEWTLLKGGEALFTLPRADVRPIA